MQYHLDQLANGLRVLTVPMRGRDSASVAIWVRTGARYETNRVSGVSHFLEHMLFKGTRKRSTRQIKEEIEGVGGLLNAFTSEEVTCYYAKLLREHFPQALEVLSDMVNNATLDATELKKERTVILEEIKMYRDLPSHYVHDLMGELLWPEQPLGRPISGTVESVSKISRAQMVGYRDRYYSPKNILVSVSGDIGHDEVMAEVKKWFEVRSGGRLGQFTSVLRRRPRFNSYFLDKKTEQTHFVIGMHGFSRFNPDRYKLGVLNVLLGANMSSRLFEEVREKRGLAYEIRSGLSYYHDTGSLTISAGVEIKKAPVAIRVILKELSKLKKSLVGEGELRRAKDYFLSQLYLALEDTMEHLLWVGERTIDREELPDHQKIRHEIESVTVRDVQDICRRLFKDENLHLALIGPVEGKVQKTIEKNFEL